MTVCRRYKGNGVSVEAELTHLSGFQNAYTDQYRGALLVESRSLPLAVLIQRAFPYTQSQIDLKFAVGADLAPEDAAHQINLAKTERNSDNGRPLGMKANWD